MRFTTTTSLFLTTLSTFHALSTALPHFDLTRRRVVPTYSVVDVMDPEASIPGFPVVNPDDDVDVTVTKTVTRTQPPHTITRSYISTATVVSIVDVKETQKPPVKTVTVVYSSSTSSSPAVVETSSAGYGAGLLPPAESSDASVPGPEYPSTALSSVAAPLSTAASATAPTATGGTFDDGMWHGQGIWNSTNVAFRFRRHK